MQPDVEEPILGNQPIGTLASLPLTLSRDNCKTMPVHQALAHPLMALCLLLQIHIQPDVALTPSNARDALSGTLMRALRPPATGRD